MNDEVKEIELETESMEHNLKMGEALNRLRNNEDFKLVIQDGYLKEKVLSSVSLLAVPQIKSEGRRGDIMEDLVAASNLQYFFQMVDHFYEGAVNPILSDEEEDELRELQENEGTH